jgi:hypothetical protein
MCTLKNKNVQIFNAVISVEYFEVLIERLILSLLSPVTLATSSIRGLMMGKSYVYGNLS